MRIYKLTNRLLFILCLFTGLVSCNEKGLNNYNIVENSLTLDKGSAEMSPGDQLLLTPKFDIKGSTHRTYYWFTDNSRIIDIVQHDNLSATIVAKRLGEAKVTIKSTDGELEATCDINIVKSATGGIIRILTIGNGFSEDAVEGYLYNLAKQANIKIEIGDLYLKDATLAMHKDNTDSTQEVYQFRLIDQFGNKTNTSKVSLATAVSSDDWDYISFQQDVAVSGMFDTYSDVLPDLFNYVKERATNPDVKFVFHQTWAYQQNADAAGFANYGDDQLTMYNAIVDAVSDAADLVPVDIVVPAGTAIQNARTSYMGDNLCRDGAHLNDQGKYVAACAWFEALFNKNVVGNQYIPKELSLYEGEIAQHAAHSAIETPESVTAMTDYQAPGFLKNVIFVGFGSQAIVDGWNAFLTTNFSTGAKIDNLVDQDGRKTGIPVEITIAFNGKNDNGVAEVSTDFAIPSAVSQHSYFGNGKGNFGGKEVRESAFKMSNLNKDQMLNFCFFASRNGVGDIRETKYVVQGENTVTAYLNTSNNSSQTACASGVKPDANGTITVTVTMGEGNNNGDGFFYISAMRVTPAN